MNTSSPPEENDEFGQHLAKIAEKSQKLIVDFLSRRGGSDQSPDLQPDPLNIGGPFLEMTTRLMSDPAKLANAQMALWKGYLDLWTSTAQRMMGEPAPSVVEPEKGDKRFTHPDWEENAVFDFLKQSYLLSSKWMLETVRQVDGLDEQAARKVDFYTRQFIDALSPTNFVMSNPEVLRATLESHGENLLKGLENLLTDLERSKGQQLRITMTDPNAFKVGQDLAVTPGKVIYRNDLMELIQYAPATEEVYQKPLLIVPPWINKFYILDLRPKNSFIKWATEQGFTVFAISWVNPDSSLGQKTFEDYLSEGPLAALEVIQSITGSESINGVGYCLGGTLLAIAMAYLESKGSPIIESGTFLTTMIDFQEAGELGVFIDEAQLTALEQQMSEQGYLDGASMANTFNLLRANDLIWSFVINNYLLGKEPFPFDLLYWNSDSTRMPGAMHSFYLRNMYQKNLLTRPGGISMLGTPIDLSGITCPAFFLSTREDHIAPWKSTFSGAKILSGETQFVLAASGHIAGVVNPPEKGKYCFWTNGKPAGEPGNWLEAAERQEGSWWPYWGRWIAEKSGPKVSALQGPGNPQYTPIADAPGEYVRVRADLTAEELKARTA